MRMATSEPLPQRTMCKSRRLRGHEPLSPSTPERVVGSATTPPCVGNPSTSISAGQTHYTTCTHIGRKMEHLGQTNTHHMYTHSVRRWVHLDRVQAERWSILARQTQNTCTHILSKDGCILTESRPKDGAS